MARKPLAVNVTAPDEAARAKAAAAALETGAPSPRPGRMTETAGMVAPVTTAVHLERKTLELLQDVASARQRMGGGRKSASSVIRDLIERHRDELVEEIRAAGMTPRD